jgi:NAD(P)-dependent dehydrogenase (short-subunit alcohol dehydrogenase family)
MTKKSEVVLITGASSGFGRLTAVTLARAGYTVAAGMRDLKGRNAQPAADLRALSDAEGLTIDTVELDVQSQSSADAAVDEILTSHGHLDVIVHNAGHMVLGPTEAFTVEQIAEVYDTNVLSTQRVNRAVLPHLRARKDGLLIWVGSTSTRGGTPPYLAPYFAAKAAEDSLAVSYAAEVARFGIDSVIVVPGSFTTGTNHFAHAGHAEDVDTAAAYDAVLPGLMDQVGARLAELAPDDADPEEVARQIVRVVDTPKGQRPFRVHIDPADDGAEEVNAVGDRVRRDFYARIGLDDLLGPAAG